MESERVFSSIAFAEYDGLRDPLLQQVFETDLAKNPARSVPSGDTCTDLCKLRSRFVDVKSQRLVVEICLDNKSKGKPS